MDKDNELKSHIAILVEGTVVPFYLDTDGIINLGNIFDNSIEKIINSKRYKNLKQSFQDNKPWEKLCISCKYKEKSKK